MLTVVGALSKDHGLHRSPQQTERRRSWTHRENCRVWHGDRRWAKVVGKWCLWTLLVQGCLQPSVCGKKGQIFAKHHRRSLPILEEPRLISFNPSTHPWKRHHLPGQQSPPLSPEVSCAPLGWPVPSLQLESCGPALGHHRFLCIF